MAGNEDGDTIEGAGAGHGASRLGHSHLSGQSAVSPSFAWRDFPQRLPYAKLKGRAAEIEWKRVAGWAVLRANVLHNRSDGLTQLWVGADGCDGELGA